MNAEDSKIKKFFGTEESFVTYLRTHLGDLAHELAIQEPRVVTHDLPYNGVAADLVVQDAQNKIYAIEVQKCHANMDHAKALTYGLLYDADAVVWIAEECTDYVMEAMKRFVDYGREDARLSRVTLLVVDVISPSEFRLKRAYDKRREQ